MQIFIRGISGDRSPAIGKIMAATVARREQGGRDESVTALYVVYSIPMRGYAEFEYGIRRAHK
jgi:hypothetical protein